MSTAIRYHVTSLEKARVTKPKPSKARPGSRARRRVPGEYNPRVASRGLTVDTDLGPVDEVAVERALAGRGPITLTTAEYEEVLARLAALPIVTRWTASTSRYEQVAEAIGYDVGTVKKHVAAKRTRLALIAAAAADKGEEATS